MNQRIKYIDIAKGIGIVFVVCSHTDAWRLMWITSGFFVPIFFFCSGYTFSSIKGTIVEMMKKRFRKLFVPYLFFTVVLMCFFNHFTLREIVGFLYSRYCFYPIDTEPNVKFMTTGNYPMWFLTSMIISYFLFYVILYNEKYKVHISLSYFVIALLLRYFPILLPWSIDTAFFTSLIMYAGKIMKSKSLTDLSGWIILLMTLFYIVLRYTVGNINLSVRIYGTSVILYYVLSVCGSVIVLWVSHYIEKNWIGHALMILGKHSLTIFCIQMIFIVVVQRLYAYMFPDMTLGWAIGLIEVLVALLGGLLVSLLLHKSKFFSHLLF